MLRKYFFLPMFAALCLLFFMASVALAQAQISDADLEKAAAAHQEVFSITQEYQHSLQVAEDLSARQRLQEEANQKMVQAIEGQGLDVDTYNRIMEQVNTDPETRQRFTEMRQIGAPPPAPR